jgi:lysophospholipase L1-like esterase
MTLARRLALLTAVLVAACTALSAGSAGADEPVRGGYYLSLGDSLAFGFQPDLFAAGDVSPVDYRGYAEDFADMRTGLTLVNYGCPGETTSTLINGGCPWLPLPLHDPLGSATSQLGAALAFLAAHPGQVSLISIDIGSNDLLALVGTCQAQGGDVQSCLRAGLPATLATLAHNYGVILTSLQALAPDAQIIVFNFYNPLAEVLAGSDALLAVVNQTLAGIATAFHAGLADAFTAINLSAGSPAEPALICARTWECTSFHNIHPTDIGYRAMAVALLHAAG